MYLGLPLSPKQLRKSDYLPLLEKIDSRLAGWKGATLSRGGRLVLINSVITSIPAFFCSSFLLPAWVIEAIDKIRRGFFWKGKKLQNGFHCLAKWEHLCRPKKMGGIGIRNLRAANAALLMKGLWTFYNSQNLPWVQLLMHKHYTRRAPDLSASTPTNSSPIWKGLLKLAAPFFTSVDFSLGNGILTPFWNARWCGDIILRSRFPNLFAFSTINQISVSKWIQRFGSHQSLGFQPLNQPEARRELTQLADLIGNLVLSDQVLDSISWRWTKAGTFSTRSAYDFLTFDGINNCLIPFTWKLWIPPRVKIFLWLAARNKLLTADNLAKRGWHGPSVCALCNSDADNLEHLLLNCSFAISIWTSLLRTTPTARHRMLSLSTGLAARWCSSRKLLTRDLKIHFDLRIAAGCWELWKERNRRLFDDKRIEHGDILSRRINQTICLWTTAFGSRDKYRSTQSLV